jgi:F-type H+-transporting ATPase subunit epsilon
MLLEVVTPERLLLSEEVEEVIAPGEFGQFGVLPGHRPFVATLSVGELCFRKGEREKSIAIGEGFAEVLPDRVTVLVEWAFFGEEIDPQEAKAQKEEAEKRLKELVPLDPQYEEVLRRLKEATVKLEVFEKYHSETSKAPR